MKIKREIASIPVRTANETWQAIIDLIVRDGSVDAGTLKAAASVMEFLIADEHPATVPIIVKGEGPLLVIYLLYNEAAMEAGKDVDPLNWNPTGSADWRMTAPTESGDAAWMNNTLKTRAPRIAVHDVAAPPADEDDNKASAAATDHALKIDWGVLSRS
jgi:hypothetical protein